MKVKRIDSDGIKISTKKENHLDFFEIGLLIYFYSKKLSVINWLISHVLEKLVCLVDVIWS